MAGHSIHVADIEGLGLVGSRRTEFVLQRMLGLNFRRFAALIRRPSAIASTD